MTQRLRILIEVDGVAWSDRDIIVESVAVNTHNGIRQAPSDGPYIKHELSGDHTITIDYRDVFAEARP